MRVNYQKVLLVNPGRNPLFGTSEPLNLALLAAFVRSKGYSVLIADELAGEDFIRKEQEFQPDIVGITSTSALIKDASRVAEYFKQRKVPTVLGGVHATTCPDESLKTFDMVVKGEGEYPLLKILSEGHEKGVFVSETAVDINQMPLPARDLLCFRYYSTIRQRFPQFGWFIHFPWDARVQSVVISRGCYGTCAFCQNLWHGLPYRIYSPDKVIEELTALKRNQGIDQVIFVDDNLFADRQKIKEILLALADSRLKMTWAASSRVDSLDEELLELAKKAGCIKLNFGFESGSQKILDRLGKGTSVKNAAEIVRLCRKQQIKVSGFFIAGHPDETRSDVNLTIKMIRQLRLDSIGTAIATPFPATGWWKIAEERKLIPDRIAWEMFDLEQIPIQLNQNFSAKQLRNIRFRYYCYALLVNPGYLWRMIKATFLSVETLKEKLIRIIS